MTSSDERMDADERRIVESVLRGGGEMGALMRSIDWSRTAVGPVRDWPQSLRTALSILLETGFPMYIAWGPGFTQFYNDGYRPILGSTKHPAAMGIGTPETFAEIWDIIGPMFRRCLEGTATTVEDFLLPLDRHGFVEECYFIFSYSPIRQEDGTAGGVLVTVTETTRRILGERRLRLSQALAARTKKSATVLEACAIAGQVLAEGPLDLPFAAIWMLDRDERVATLAGVAHLEAGGPATPQRITLSEDHAPWPLARALETRRCVVVDTLPDDPTLAGEPPAPTRAVVLPILEQGTGRALGLLVAGVSPRLRLDGDYAAFHDLIAAQIGTAMTSAWAFEDAKARAEALAELDRQKTAFFSNVSHEFRTPLTLMLAPTEEALASQDRALRGEDLETVHRNELRLLKLVNTLLDFSRVEAGRTEGQFEPLDLAAETTDLASAFRSAIERAGLRLDVRCPSLPAPVWVDRGMWEKIVLNLLSNALKFTFAGGIDVALTWRDDEVELAVSDTGVGIPADELPRIFDRFHRVASTRARTHEGSGIGLALVRELVKMHGGTISASSTPGEETSFRVTIPTGRGHLPPERIVDATARPPARQTPAYVEEALRWLPAEQPGAPAGAAMSEVRIAVVDDNADMRDYLARLLGERWAVETFGDGLSALEAIRRAPPDLVLTDVMMPGIDGFELLLRLRADERTRGVPIIMLSARAGEEARLEGLHAGADDYLVKPFSAREIMARVQAQIVSTKIRSVEQAHGNRLAMVFEQAPVAVALLEG
ncbi:MAG TPA: ATP-binding protein, partial [Nannocystaceae bacterium]|nr:ATP-binding protein [Nannocystaceae bacterium]